MGQNDFPATGPAPAPQRSGALARDLICARVKSAFAEAWIGRQLRAVHVPDASTSHPKVVAAASDRFVPRRARRKKSPAPARICGTTCISRPASRSAATRKRLASATPCPANAASMANAVWLRRMSLPPRQFPAETGDAPQARRRRVARQGEPPDRCHRHGSSTPSPSRGS